MARLLAGDKAKMRVKIAKDVLLQLKNVVRNKGTYIVKKETK